MGNAESDLNKPDDITQVSDGNSLRFPNEESKQPSDDQVKKHTELENDDKNQILSHVMKKIPNTFKKRTLDSNITHGDSSQPNSNSSNQPLNYATKGPQHKERYDSQSALHTIETSHQLGDQSQPLGGFETPHSQPNPLHQTLKSPIDHKPHTSPHAISQNNTPNGISTGKTNKINRTINVMMYPSHTRSPATASMDPSKLIESLKIDETDWETKWENDDNDDDSSEDEDKEDEVKNLTSSGRASSHPFRPGMDLGHSSSSQLNPNLSNVHNHVYPTSSNISNMASIRPSNNRIENSSRTAQHTTNHRRLAATLYGNHITSRDDQHSYRSSDRPGVRMFSMLRVLGKGSFGKVRSG